MSLHKKRPVGKTGIIMKFCKHRGIKCINLPIVITDQAEPIVEGKIKEEKMDSLGFKVHILENGDRVVITSPHGFRFSDGTESVEGASHEAADMIYVGRTMVEVRPRVVASKLSLEEEALATLASLNCEGEWVVVPFMVVAALREAGLRDDPRFSNVVAFNATKETRRSAPQDKIIDIDSWAW